MLWRKRNGEGTEGIGILNKTVGETPLKRGVLVRGSIPGSRNSRCKGSAVGVVGARNQVAGAEWGVTKGSER